MNAFTGAAVVFLFVVYIGLIALGLFILYLIIREAVSRSRLADQLAAIQMELQRLNAQLYTFRQNGEDGDRREG